MKYEYLALLTDISSYLKPVEYTLTEYKQEMQSKALINLYLSSLADLGTKQHKVGDYEDPI